MEQRGKLHSWNDDKGFGFIQPDQGGARLFVHISAMRGAARPQVGEVVFYVPGTDDNGRPRAVQMRSEQLSVDRPAIRRKPIAQARRESAPRPVPVRRHVRASVSGGIQNLPVKLALFILLCGLPLAGGVHLLVEYRQIWPLLLYVFASIVCFLLYWSDKQHALNGRWRTPENLLHLSELLCGWPGALVAQQLLRHKTRKVSYQAAFWLIVLVHQAFWADWLLLDGDFTGRWIQPMLG